MSAKKKETRRTVVVVYPPKKGTKEWEIWLSNCIEAGTHVASAVNRDDANRTCVTIAMRTQSRALLVRRGENPEPAT